MSHTNRVAEFCPTAGEAPASVPRWHGVTDAVLPGSFPSEELGSCRECKHLCVSNDESIPDRMKVCGATGCAIDTEQTYKSCPFAEAGISTRISDPLNAVITDASAIAAGTAAAVKVVSRARGDMMEATPDPAEYVTDMEIAPEYEGIIRAWRLIEVGEGDKKLGVFLPIFEPDYFTDEQRDLIPKHGGADHPELYFDGDGLVETFTVDSWMNGEPLCLVGEPGVGKTEGARYIAYLMQMPFTHLQLTEETLPDEFLGRPAYSPEKGTHFVWGRLPRAIASAGLVLSDEVNTAQDSIRQTYRSLNSASGTIFLDGEEDGTKHVVRKHNYCFHMLALNPAWDPRNLGVREMADADVSRMSFKWLSEPDDKTIAKIILAKLDSEGLTITDDELQGMLTVRKDIKELSSAGALPFSWSIRQDVKVAKKLAYYSPQTAYRRALLDYCHPTTAEAVGKAVASVFGFGN